MRPNYAREKLYQAVRSAIQSDKPVQQRLLECYLELHALDYGKHLPPHLQPRLKEMIQAWTPEPDPTGKQWSVAATLERMEDEEARKWLEEILKLFTEVAVAEASMKRQAIGSKRKALKLTRLRGKQGKAIDVFCEIYQLLEDFAPAWYSEELHERANEALRVLGRVKESHDCTRVVCAKDVTSSQDSSRRTGDQKGAGVPGSTPKHN